uniref:Uncharacterized protein n=1 Tax=Ciona savignyi TaxID=51511 RepID=H2YEG5_CIOSA
MDIEKLLAKYGRVASKTEEAINRNNISIDDQSDSDSVSGRSKHYIKNSVEENSLNNLVSLVNSAQKKLKSQENNSSKMQDSSIKEPNIAIALEDDKEAQQKTDSGYVNKIPKLKKTFVKTKTSKGNDSEDEDYLESESESESESECDDE